MKIFLDANILVAVLNKEYPVFSHAARILSLSDKSEYQLYTTTVCLAIAFYFSEKKHGAKEAKKKISLLVEHLEIADCGKKEAIQAIQNTKIKDFEDGLEYYAAVYAGCGYIITEDLKDFYFSELVVMNAEQFLRTVVSAKKQA